MEPSRKANPQQASMDQANIGLRVTVYNDVDGRTTDLLFQQFPIRIGRNSMNDLVLNHQYVSQWHAVFSLGHQGVALTQVGSSNSVQIGELKLQPNEEVLLSGGEAIRIVPFLLRVQPVALPGEPPRSGSATYQSAFAAPAAGEGQALLERTALKVLDRLSSRFVGRPLEEPRDVAAFGARLEATLGVFLRFFVALKAGQEQFRQALDIKALAKGGARNLAERAEDSSELAAYLLGTDGPSPIHALEGAFKNIMLHQVALINGLMAGVHSLLARLSPKAVAEDASQDHRSPSHRVLWETYQNIHKDLSEEDNEAFETIFGPQFAKAYSNLVGKKAGAK